MLKNPHLRKVQKHWEQAKKDNPASNKLTDNLRFKKLKIILR
jgi:hypothetical protein